MKAAQILLLCSLLACSACDDVDDAANGAGSELQQLRQQALQLHNAGQSDEAIRQFESIAEHPELSASDKADVLRNISLGYYEAGDYAKSGEYARRAAQLLPEGSPLYLVNMADAELMAGEVEAAISRLEQAYRLEPDSLAVNNVLGLIYLGDNGRQYQDLDKALRHNQAAYRISPNRITRIVLVRTLLARGEREQAGEHLRELRETYPQDEQLQHLQQQAEASAG